MTTDAQRRVAVAQAICKSRTCEGIACCQWPANGGRTNCPVKNGGYDDAAAAAIAALAPAPGGAREVAEKIVADWWVYCTPTALVDAIATALLAHSQAAVARERAECAKVARDFAARRNFGQTTAEHIAAAIEARGQKEGGE